MKRVLILLLSAVLMTAALTGCSSGEEDALVSKTPFPEFSEVDIAGDEISSDIFADYDATIVNFWNNGCGSCIAEMPELEELYQDFKERNINLIGVGTDSGEGDFEGKGRDLSQYLSGSGGRFLQGLRCGYFHLSHYIYRGQRGKHRGCGYRGQCEEAAGHRGDPAGADHRPEIE